VADFVGAEVVGTEVVGEAGVAMLGQVMAPEMEKRGYNKSMSMGPILGAGGLAIFIPPSAITVLLGSIADISVGKMLMGIIIPGLLLATIYAIYIIVRCYLNPSLAPTYTPPSRAHI
jgi:TRAP-type mannitol/chloroaromatic compound transport system permease large subunit